MSESLASFRDLKGIGPATEARLHEAGIYTWEALAAAATALAAAARGNGDTLREVATLVAERRGEAGGQAAPRPPGAERHEAFVLRMALAADGEPRRSTVTHVRTMAEQVSAGWNRAELARFVEKHAGVRPQPAAREEPAPEKPAPRGRARRAPAPRRAPSTQHVLVLDAGKAIGGAGRDVDLVVANTGAAKAGFGYRATLAARPLGAGDRSWTAIASQAGTGSPERNLSLRFPEVRVPDGVQRLQLRLEVSLPASTSRPPALTLATPEAAGVS
jgi:predicted flap endonuclease-1-like 5' DNA nuclease